MTRPAAASAAPPAPESRRSAPGSSPAEGRARDAASLARVAAGDERAFAELYERHRGRVFRLAYAMVLDREEAREVTQEAFVALHRVAARWRPDARVSTWLHHTTFRLASGVRRRLRRWASGTATASAPPSPEDASDAAGRWAFVVEGLRTLPARQRGVVELHVEEDMTPAEIADALGISANAVRVSLHKGMARLRAHLEAHAAGRHA